MGGLIGRKLGMTQIIGEDSRVVPVTVIEAGPCPVVQIKVAERDGYSAAQLGFGSRSKRSINKPLQGHLSKSGAESIRVLKEFPLDESEDLSVGQEVTVEQFQVGDIVDVTGVSKGRGFTGVVKRWKFKGGGDGHGAKGHRAPGSIGGSAYPGRVWKGLKMAGHSGSERVTAKRLTVVHVDPERNRMAVRGAVPGARNGLLFIKKTRSQEG